MENECVAWANLTLKIISVLDAEDLWCVPGIATNTFEPVQIILVEDLGRGKMLWLKLVSVHRIQECSYLISFTYNKATKHPDLSYFLRNKQKRNRKNSMWFN